MRSPEWVARMDHLAAEGIPFLFVLDFELAMPIIKPLSELIDSGADKNEPAIRYQIRETNTGYPSTIASINLKKSPIPFEEYQMGFDQALAAIKAGDTYLLNLCYSTRLSNIDSLTEIFDTVKAPYKLLVDEQFVVFSPEQFVSVTEGVIRTYPMKGTIDASLPDAEAVLLGDIKEQEEHATVVDLLRNDLSIVANHVTVNNYRFITRISTAAKSLLQCSSEISGVLKAEFASKPGSMMHALLPAGSITGAPKKRTVELINHIEAEPRKYFTGVFGVYDGKNLDSAVMIRMIEQREDGLYYRSGGGITYQSNAAQEYREMIDKVYIPL